MKINLKKIETIAAYVAIIYIFGCLLFGIIGTVIYEYRYPSISPERKKVNMVLKDVHYKEILKIDGYDPGKGDENIPSMAGVAYLEIWGENNIYNKFQYYLKPQFFGGEYKESKEGNEHYNILKDLIGKEITIWCKGGYSVRTADILLNIEYDMRRVDK